MNDFGEHEIHKLRKGTRIYHGRLKSMDGNVVESNQRAETFAQYLERVQWAVRPVSTMQFSHDLGLPLPVPRFFFLDAEVLLAAGKLKCNRACGPDLVPPEFWKCICSNNTSRTWATQLCNSIWCHGDIPDDWHDAFVAMIFKKGDPSRCVNYRPISLLSIGYKLFAKVLFQRLLASGAESRIWHTPFVFRSHRGTADAIFVATRLIEQTWSKHEGRLVFVALDWAKAFDSISPESLVHAFRRFGLPSNVCDIVRNIYKGRRFTVRDGGHQSRPHAQQFGISLRCPLSPVLFSMLMTVLISDVPRNLQEWSPEIKNPDMVNELLYADDTLVIALDDARAQGYMTCIAQAGANYGLLFNWRKLEVLPIGRDGFISNPDGQFIECKKSISYLGALLAADVSAGSEVNRRLGPARADFSALSRVWKHFSLPVSGAKTLYFQRMRGLSGDVWLAHRLAEES